MVETCIKKHCKPKDKDGKPIKPTLMRVFMTPAMGQFRDAEQYHCGGCGERWTQLTTVRTKAEYKIWKAKEDEAIKKVMDKIQEQKRSNSAAEAALPSLEKNAI